MLLHLTCPALASHSRKLVLVKQLDDDVLARPRVRANNGRQPISGITIQQPAEESSELHGAITLGHHTRYGDGSMNLLTEVEVVDPEPRNRGKPTVSRMCHSRRSPG